MTQNLRSTTAGPVTAPNTRIVNDQSLLAMMTRVRTSYQVRMESHTASIADSLAQKTFMVLDCA